MDMLWFKNAGEIIVDLSVILISQYVIAGARQTIKNVNPVNANLNPQR